MKNQYFDDWYQTSQLIFDGVKHGHQTMESSGLDGSHIGGAATLAGTYLAAGIMLKTGNPYLMAAGGAILLIPDPVIYGIGYVLFD